jgi:ABC-type polysaccharide/polyol phosphate export permease
MPSAVSALTRAAWYQARSYRLSLVMQAGGLLFTVVPLFFISQALQETMASTIAGEADQYFAFVLVGSVGLALSTLAMSTLPRMIGAGISSGYFESLLMTRAPVGSILAGLSSYELLLTTVRVLVMITAGWILGASVAWSQSLSAVFILALLVLAHWGVGLVAGALVIAFRTAGPIVQIVSTISIFFGGVYYPVSSIPSWLGAIADITPLAYGLRALRRVLLQGDNLTAVWEDVAMVAAIGVLLLMGGALAIQVALRYARRAGSLGSY